MAKLVFGMSQSLDGYVDDAAGTLCMPPPGPAVFRHFVDVVAGHAGAIYGRRIYEVMRYWDVDRPEWDEAQREFAAAWQRQPKWIASRMLASVGPNATLIRGDLDVFVRDLKATVDGELDVAGPELAAAIAPLIDEYRLYFRPYVLGGGKPYFAGARPPLRLVATDRIGDDVVRLTYVPIVGDTLQLSGGASIADAAKLTDPTRLARGVAVARCDGMSIQRVLSISIAFACACSNAGSGDTQDGPPPDASIADDAAAASAPDATADAAAKTALKRHYGHYFATNYNDTPADAAMLCSKPGVTGVVWRQTWREVETARGSYNFHAFDSVLAALAASPNPNCQLWLFIEFKSFANSPVKNPCPVYLASAHSAVNSLGNGASTCFMWEPVVYNAYIAMMKAAAGHYDMNPRVEGIIFEESALSLDGAASQDVANGGTYTPLAWRNALIALVDAGAAAFQHSRVLAFLNFIRGGQAYLDDVSAAISAVPNDQACYSGPDLLPDNTSLYNNAHSTYEQLVRHTGCRSNSAQNDSYGVTNFGLDSIFRFAVGGTFGSFDASAPRTGGVCINSYLFWNHLEATSSTGLTWNDALPVIAAHPYGAGWYGQCAGGGAVP